MRGRALLPSTFQPEHHPRQPILDRQARHHLAAVVHAGWQVVRQGHRERNFHFEATLLELGVVELAQLQLLIDDQTRTFSSQIAVNEVFDGFGRLRVVLLPTRPEDALFTD